MYFASFNGYARVLRELVKRGASVNEVVSHTGCTPLMMACRGGHYDLAQEMILVFRASTSTTDKVGVFAFAFAFAFERVACGFYNRSNRSSAKFHITNHSLFGSLEC